VISGPLEWQPVLARELPGAETFESLRSDKVAQPAEGRRTEPLVFAHTEVQAFRADVQRRAADLGLQPLRWPADFPFDSELAMLVATYAKSIGRVVPFAQAAFRQAFAGGHTLASTDNVLIAAAACEMHPAAVLKAIKLTSIRERLSAATAEAAELGVTCVPALLTDFGSVDKRILVGKDALGQAVGA
jgi:2-hydroxychromene-2-carboxylate isomerase